MQSEYMIARYKEIKERIGKHEARTDDILFLMTALDKAQGFIKMHQSIAKGKTEEAAAYKAELERAKKHLNAHADLARAGRKLIEDVTGVKGFRKGAKIRKAVAEAKGALT